MRIRVLADTDRMTAEIPGTALDAMQKRHAVLKIETKVGAYTLPADQMAKELMIGVEQPDQVKLHIDISLSGADKAAQLNAIAEQEGFTSLGAPVDFRITADIGDKQVEVAQFFGYVQREIYVTDPSAKVTTAIRINADGTITHVPTYVSVEGGKYIAVINSLTNSAYSLVWHTLSFPDVKGRWSEDAVTDMASRMVFYGEPDGSFRSDDAITRAEFAAALVRALGLSEGEGGVLPGFADVGESDWFADAIVTATEYGLIHGYGDGTFRPNQPITRKEAFAMVANAMHWTNIQANEDDGGASAALNRYADHAQLSLWAEGEAEELVRFGIVAVYRSRLFPGNPTVRAEAASLVESFLVKSGLINGR